MRTLIFLFTLALAQFSNAQLSSVGISYGIGGINDLNSKIKFPSHQIHLDYNQYLARSISAGINMNYSTTTLNQSTEDSISVGKYNTFGLELNFKWWFLNDFRLMGKMAKSSCKGKLVALSYNFRMYLMANFGYNFNLSNNANLRGGALFLGGGLGINFWQFGLGRNGARRVHQGVKHILIPFAEVQYLYNFTDVMSSDQSIWKPHMLPIKIGVKLAFTYF